MKRYAVEAKAQPQTLVEREFPLDWDVCYELTLEQCDELELATVELDTLSLKAVERVVKDPVLLRRLGIKDEFRGHVRRSWERGDPSVYGRFDFGYDGKSPPKMLEYNADTPTTLIESAVTQWQWFEAHFGGKAGYNQLNTVHEMLIERWKELVPLMKKGTPLYFLTMQNSLEEFATAEYLRDLAAQAGVATEFLYIEDLGWDSKQKRFVDLENRPVGYAFKLYPSEWMMREKFAQHLLEAEYDTGWIEPLWKAILSNKGILPILWEMFPHHPNLLPAFWEWDRHLGSDYIVKPLGGRGGENLRIVSPTLGMETGGNYGDEPKIYQKLYPLPRLDGTHYFTIGSWVVGDKSAGICVREDEKPIMVDKSRLVPHVFTE